MAENRKKRWFRFGLRTLPRTFVFLVLSVYSSEACYGGDEANTPSNASVARLIQLLGSDDFTVRERAVSDLVAAGDGVRSQVIQASRESKDPEVRDRARDVLERLDRLQLTASEMHVVGVSQASRHGFWLIHPSERRTAWKPLLVELAEKGEDHRRTPGKRLWELLSPDVQDIARDNKLIDIFHTYLTRRQDPEFAKRLQKDPATREIIAKGVQIRHKVEKAMCSALRRGDFFKAEYFSDIELTGEAKDLLLRYGAISDLERLIVNRRLVEAAFPDAIDKLDFTLDDATITVHVAPTKGPINLVLCNYDPVNWKIVCESGAQIKNVIVGGYEVQNVSGTEAPIRRYVFHASDPDVEERKYFFAHQKDDVQYSKMTAMLRGLTGMEITSFQGDRAKEKRADYRVPPLAVDASDAPK